MVVPSSICSVLLLLLASAACKTHDVRTAQRVLGEVPSFVQESIFRTPSRIQGAQKATEDLAGPVFNTFDDFTEDIPYAGIATFAHLNTTNCFSSDSDNAFDIGVVGAPFDLGVTYRPGARFGPAGTRMGSRRLSPSMAYRYALCLI